MSNRGVVACLVGSVACALAVLVAVAADAIAAAWALWWVFLLLGTAAALGGENTR